MLIVSTAESCERLDTVAAMPGTSNVSRAPYPTHWECEPDAENGLERQTRFKAEGILPLPVANIKAVIGRISRRQYMEMQDAILNTIHFEDTEW